MKSEKIQRVFKLIMLIFLTALITFMITTIVMYNKNGVKYVITTGDSSELSKRLESYVQFIKEQYLGEIDEEKVIEGAIAGYVEGLGDQYSEYISKNEMKEYMEQTNGKYVGIGVYITANIKENKIQVVAPIKGSPAEKIGIKTGDYIIKVEGIEYSSSELDKAASAMRGEEGTKVNIEILRGEETIKYTVERKSIKINHVESKIIQNDIGYIEISTFDDGTYDEFIEAYKELKNSNIKSLIIDLRDNGGGIVDEALEIADTMVDKGSNLLITTSKNNGENIRKAKENKTIDLNIVFLVNENTASASEILTAAVKENTNAKVVGVRTYGKGVIQTIYTLKDGGGLKLTTNEYFTPNRNKINKLGIKPDFEVNLPDEKTLYDIEENEDTQLTKAIEVLKNM